MKGSLNINHHFIELTEKHFNSKVLSYKKLGNGATGNVYKLELAEAPFAVALKISSDSELTKQESNYLTILSDKVKHGFPKVYFTVFDVPGQYAICMELFDGVSANSVKSSLKILFKGKIFADGAINALFELHKVTNNKFGPIDNAVFESWNDYYKPFAESVLSFAQKRAASGELAANVIIAMETAFSHYDEIFAEHIEKPALSHGDFWPPNLILNPKTMEFLGAVDPFNVMWADPEYDLFAMLAGKGKQYKLVETYKKKNRVSKHLYLKLEFYALFNEMDWYSKIGSKYDSFLIYKSKRLLSELKKAKIV